LGKWTLDVVFSGMFSDKSKPGLAFLKEALPLSRIPILKQT
jgi:hypothetical protein